MKINYKGKRYLVTGKAYTMNGGEYYVCYEMDTNDEKAHLIPADSDEVEMITM